MTYSTSKQFADRVFRNSLYGSYNLPPIARAWFAPPPSPRDHAEAPIRDASAVIAFVQDLTYVSPEKGGRGKDEVAAAAVVAVSLIGWQLLGGGYFAGSH